MDLRKICSVKEFEKSDKNAFELTLENYENLECDDIDI